MVTGTVGSTRVVGTSLHDLCCSILGLLSSMKIWLLMVWGMPSSLIVRLLRARWSRLRWWLRSYMCMLGMMHNGRASTLDCNRLDGWMYTMYTVRRSGRC